MLSRSKRVDERRSFRCIAEKSVLSNTVLKKSWRASGNIGKHVAGSLKLLQLDQPGGVSVCVTSGRILLDTTFFVMSLPHTMFRSPIFRAMLGGAARRQLSTMPQTYVKRVTLFKVPKPEDVDQASLLHITMATVAGTDWCRSCYKLMKS